MTDLFPVAAELGAARSQMAFTLGFHIVLACLGVGLPAIILIANWLGLKRNDEVALDLARRWSKVAAVTFVVGAITGTVLSFEMGLLWPEFMRRYPEVELDVALIDRVVDIVDEGYDMAVRISRSGSTAHAARKLASSRNVI